MSAPIVVIGSYVQDLTFFTPQFPRPGETVIGTFKTGPGGKGSNQAIAAQRAGVPTAFIGAVGDDAFASVAKDFHIQEGVDARWHNIEGVSTGAASIVVNDQGQNEIVVALGANDHLASDAVTQHMPESAEVVVTQLETNLEGSIVAMELGRSMEALTVLNPAPVRNDFPPAILSDVDVIIPNETEFVSILSILNSEHWGDFSESDLLDLDAADLHNICRAIGVPIVILTMGARGAFLSTPDRYRQFPPLKGIEAVDTTGAGDAFVGGFAAGWVLYKQNLDLAVQYGIIVSGLSVTQVGTAPAMPHVDQIQQIINDHAFQF